MYRPAIYLQLIEWISDLLQKYFSNNADFLKKFVFRVNTHKINQHKFQQISCQFDNTIQCNFHRELETVNWHSRTQLNNFSYFVSYLGSNFHMHFNTIDLFIYSLAVFCYNLLWNSTFCFFSCFCCCSLGFCAGWPLATLVLGCLYSASSNSIIDYQMIMMMITILFKIWFALSVLE